MRYRCWGTADTNENRKFVVLSTATTAQSVAADKYVEHVGFVTDVINERYTDVYAKYDAAACATTATFLVVWSQRPVSQVHVTMLSTSPNQPLAATQQVVVGDNERPFPLQAPEGAMTETTEGPEPDLVEQQKQQSGLVRICTQTIGSTALRQRIARLPPHVLRQKQEEQMYLRKSYFLKRTIKALVFVRHF
uniref:Uncharacterized protein n=1 Tax=Parascaris equorum TaxID=6256 RepID=A0A914S3S4_PAREQ